MIRYGTTTLQPNTWYYVAGVYNAAARDDARLLNGELDNGALVGTVTSTQQDSTENVDIGRRSDGGFNFDGRSTTSASTTAR